MTDFMLGGLVVLGAVLATIGATGFVAFRCFKLGLETGRDDAWARHDRDHVGELTAPEPAEDEPEPEQYRVTVVDGGSGPRHALRPDVWIAPEDLDETAWPAQDTEDPGTERLPAVSRG